MKSDIVLMSLINFLVPLVLIYAFFSLLDYGNSGFFAIIYSAVLFIIAFMIYGVKFSTLQPSTLISIRLIAWLGLSAALFYTMLILLFLIGIAPKVHF